MKKKIKLPKKYIEVDFLFFNEAEVITFFKTLMGLPTNISQNIFERLGMRINFYWQGITPVALQKELLIFLQKRFKTNAKKI